MSSMPTASFRRCSGTGVLSAAALRSGKSDQFRSLFDQIADGKPNRLDGSVDGCSHHVLHLHRLDDHQRLAPPHEITHPDEQLDDAPWHRGGQTASPRIIAFTRGERVDLDQPPVFTGEKYRGLKAVIEHRGGPADTVEQNGQTAIGQALAGGTDGSPVDLQQPISCSRRGDDRPLVRTVAKNHDLMAVAAQPPAIATRPWRIRIAGASRRCRRY